MVSLSKYLRQRGTLYTPGETDPRTGEPAPGQEREVRARYVEESGLVRSSTGSEIRSEGVVLLEEEPVVGGSFAGEEIKGRQAIVSKTGQVLGWRAFLG